jgi:hypothetical protein
MLSNIWKKTAIVMINYYFATYLKHYLNRLINEYWKVLLLLFECWKRASAERTL